MSVTVNEAIEILKNTTEHTKVYEDDVVFTSDFVRAYEMAIKALEEIQEYRARGTVEDLINEHKELIELSRRYLIDTNELLEYQAIGTVEELQKAKMQYDNIHSVAEKIALIGLSDYGTAKESVITEIKRSLDYSLKEYQTIGTIEEFKALKEKNVEKKSKEVHENEVCIDFICPNCKEAVYGQPYKPNYCKHCGQKLDWKGGAV